MYAPAASGITHPGSLSSEATASSAIRPLSGGSALSFNLCGHPRYNAVTALAGLLLRF